MILYVNVKNRHVRIYGFPRHVQVGYASRIYAKYHQHHDLHGAWTAYEAGPTDVGHAGGDSAVPHEDCTLRFCSFFRLVFSRREMSNFRLAIGRGLEARRRR